MLVVVVDAGKQTQTHTVVLYRDCTTQTSVLLPPIKMYTHTLFLGIRPIALLQGSDMCM